MFKKLVLVGLTSISLMAWAASEIEVDQKGNAFNIKTLKIKVGDTIAFKNNDEHFHNIFSLTDGQSFDLGSYAKGQVRKHAFTKPGKVDIECAIHPAMKLIVEVVP